VLAKPTRVTEILEGIEPTIGPLAAAKGIAFGVDPCESGLSVMADPERLRQILINLAGNAVKFTPTGGWIAIRCDADAEWIAMRVQDNGPGIAPDEQDRIFDAFVQVDRRLNRPHDGVGLGLAISRNLALAMGGDLTVQSTPGAGSTFTLRLRRAPAPGPAPPAVELIAPVSA